MDEEEQGQSMLEQQENTTDNSKSEQEGFVEEGGVEVMPTPPPPPPSGGIAIGDNIYVMGGSLNGTRGKLYGFHKDRFSILPSGVSDRLIHIPLVNGKPNPELGIKNILLLQRAVKPGFVYVTDLHADAYVETFSANGVPAGMFKVVSVDDELDEATFQVLNTDGTTSEEFTIKFHFQGIPRDLPYEVIRTREPPAKEAATDATGEQKVNERIPLTIDDEDHAEGLSNVEGEEGDTSEEEIEFGEELELNVEDENILVELSSSEKIYDDATQRSEMLVQLIRLLPQAKQKDAKELQKVRRLVEVFMTMRNRVVKYGITGEPRGIQQTTFQTLSELVKTTKADLVKKVAPIQKVLYLDLGKKPKFDTHKQQNEISINYTGDYESDSIPSGQLYINYNKSVIEQANSLERTQQQEEEGDDSVQVKGLPNFYRNQKEYNEIVQTPFIVEKGRRPFTKDEELFRCVVPKIGEQGELFTLQEGNYQLPIQTEQQPFGLARLLKPRMVGSMVVDDGESPILTDYLVFPKSTEADIGAIRSGSLAKDVSRSMLPKKSMAGLLNSLKPIDDHPTVNDIIHIGVYGQLGNINLADWLRDLSLPIGGVGDAYMELKGYGMNDYEFTKEQAAVLQELIEQHLAALKLYFIQQREKNTALLQNLKYSPQSLLPEPIVERLLDAIQGEPILQGYIEEATNAMGDLAKVDLNWFTYVFLKNPDLVLAVLGKGASMTTEQALVRERSRVVRDRILDALADGFRLKKKQKEESTPAPANTCQHVKDLEACRKLAQKDLDKDDLSVEAKKMKLLLQILSTYRGKTEKDWVWCKKCGQHLICGHELMMIQEFAKPKEKDVLHKDLLLKFSGGQYAGKFICRVCGQGIQDLDYDTSLEFDDAGRPMMGRAVMEDEDGVNDEELQNLLAGDADLTDEINFGTAELNQMYRTFSTIARQIGIQPEEADYRSLVTELQTYVKTLKTRERYIELKKKAESQGHVVADYDIYMAMRYASAAIAILLLNIQTRKPDYTIYYTTPECDDGFMGYPLTSSEDSMPGVNCLVNIAAAIQDKVFPWDSTTLQSEKDVVKRKLPLKKEVLARIKEFLKIPTIQAKIDAKREYIEKVLGKKDETGEVFEVIPSQFRPLQQAALTIEQAAAEAAINVDLTPEQKAVTWMRGANTFVRETAKINEKSPFSVTTCCFHDISNPNEFWAERAEDLPALEKRVLGKPNWRSTTAKTTFYTEPIELIEGTLNPDEYFKLFLKVCYEGPNVGLPHELGFSKTCLQCGLLLKDDPNVVFVNQDEKARVEQKMRSNLEEQGVVINEDTFQNLLHATQRRQYVKPDPAPPQPNRIETLMKLTEVPPPLENWVPMLEELQKNLLQLETSEELGNEEKLFLASENLQNAILACEKQITARLGKSAFDILQSFLERPPRDCGSLIQTFFLIPFQRWLTGIKPDNFTLHKSYEISQQTIEDIFVKGLGEHLKPLGQNDFSSQLKGLLKSKIQQFVHELSFYTKHVFQTLRPMTTLGGYMITKILMRAFIMGPLSRFIDPNDIPEGENVETGATQVDMKQLLRAVAVSLAKYAKGSYIPTDTEIKITIEKRQEAENQQFIKELDVMSKDRRQVELINKQLGLGKWAVGGTKAIMQYDPARYLEEQLERQQAGIVDYEETMYGGDMHDTDFQQITEDDF